MQLINLLPASKAFVSNPHKNRKHGVKKFRMNYWGTGCGGVNYNNMALNRTQ